MPSAHRVFPVIDMKASLRIPFYLALCGILIAFLVHSDATRSAALEALRLCGTSVIPALFPFLAVSSILISTGFGRWVSPHLSRWMTPLFRLPGSAGSAVLLGLVGGYPIGARTAAELYQHKLLTRDEAERLLTFCNNSNPAFLISVLGSGVFGSVRIGVWLWLIHVASAALTGVLLSRRGADSSRRSPIPAVQEETAFLPLCVRSVGNAAAAMVSLCGFVVLFYVLARPLAALGGHLGPLLTGVLELFSLTPLLTADRFGFVLAAAYSGWGGVSVLCQAAAVLEGSGLSLKPCLEGKAVQGTLSALLALLLASYIGS